MATLNTISWDTGVLDSTRDGEGPTSMHTPQRAKYTLVVLQISTTRSCQKHVASRARDECPLHPARGCLTQSKTRSRHDPVDLRPLFTSASSPWVSLTRQYSSKSETATSWPCAVAGSTSSQRKCALWSRMSFNVTSSLQQCVSPVVRSCSQQASRVQTAH